MVTFAAATKTTSTIPTRAPAQGRVSHFVAITCSGPNDSCDLYHDACRSYAQLVSPSRDPIGYGGKDSNLFRYVTNRPIDSVDPTGLKCANWYLMSDFDNLRTLCRKVFPEFDKCERVAPVCCYIAEGKKVCRDHYGTDPDPIIPHWPERDNCPLKKDAAYRYLLKLINVNIPGNMNAACRGRNKCECGDFYSANIVCDIEMNEYFEEMVKRKMLPHNPCMRTYKWNCKESRWEDPDGASIPKTKIPATKEKVRE